MCHRQLHRSRWHALDGADGRQRGGLRRWGRRQTGEQAFSLPALGRHAPRDGGGPAQIQRDLFARDRLDQAQQGGLAVAGGLLQGLTQGFSREIGGAPLHRAEGGEHEQGLLQQGRAHRTIGHLGDAERNRLVQHGQQLTAHCTIAGAVELRQIAAAPPQGLRALQLAHPQLEAGIEQGDRHDDLLHRRGRSRRQQRRAHQAGKQRPDPERLAAHRQPCTEMR